MAERFERSFELKGTIIIGIAAVKETLVNGGTNLA